MKRIGIVGGAGWPSTVTTYSEINRLAEEKLGNGHCAEFGLKVKQEDSSVPVIDTTIEQAKAAVEYALK